VCVYARLFMRVYLYYSGGALLDVGESMKRLAEVKDSLDIDVKQNFIDIRGIHPPAQHGAVLRTRTNR
jgi:hypothetical protein